MPADQRIDNDFESKDYVDDVDDEVTASVDGFLLRLGEGLKKLPYRERSKLEIEFLARLFQMEEYLGLMDDK